MFTLSAFILLVYLNVHTDSQEIQVINSGVTKLQKDDMLMVFFVTVKHFGRNPRRAMAAPIECCETVTEDDSDCDLIDLFGGFYGLLQPGTVTNFTLIYPTWYGYNRRGYCMVKILHRDMLRSDVSEVQHRIDFDTRLRGDNTPHILMAFYKSESQTVCETPDLDPLDDCNPVDCYLKYSGQRNFYNRKVKLCQKVPVCKTDLNKDLPDVVYMPTSNTCRDLEKSVQFEDIEQLRKGEFRTSDQMVNIRCHHGEIDPRTGLCICEYGWKSEPFDPDTFNSDKTFYSMCTIKCRRDDPFKNLPVWVGLFLGMWLLFFVCLCQWSNLFEGRGSRHRDSRNMCSYRNNINFCDRAVTHLTRSSCCPRESSSLEQRTPTGR